MGWIMVVSSFVQKLQCIKNLGINLVDATEANYSK